MPKAKKRKAPIASSSTSTHASSVDAQSCRNTIRKYHVLLKRRQQLTASTSAPGSKSNASASLSSEKTATLAEVDAEIEQLGGLERYQELSVLGQREERGGGSEKIFIDWMKELGVHKIQAGQDKIKLLEVGALKPDNYKNCTSWIECTPMDLHSRHPQILEQDFLTLDLAKNEGKWDAISLSLVVNFVPTTDDRGRMLELARRCLVPNGLLYLALPLPCVTNSRYMTLEHLKSLMQFLGFTEIRERWRKNGRMGYWLYRKTESKSESDAPSNQFQGEDRFRKKTVLRTGNRNNFAITLPRRAPVGPNTKS